MTHPSRTTLDYQRLYSNNSSLSSKDVRTLPALDFGSGVGARPDPGGCSYLCWVEWGWEGDQSFGTLDNLSLSITPGISQLSTLLLGHSINWGGYFDKDHQRSHYLK